MKLVGVMLVTRCYDTGILWGLESRTLLEYQFKLRRPPSTLQPR